MDYNQEKGSAGEAKVYQIIKDGLEKMDYRWYMERNSILLFPSVFGADGSTTAELDITVFTQYYIFIFEVKNETYNSSGYNNPQWTLMNGDKVPNPLNQNHMHKLVFASELGVPREQIITIEVLLNNGKTTFQKSPYKNDYVFDEKDLHEKLIYLLATESEKQLDLDSIHKIFLKKTSLPECTPEQHKKNLKRIETIEKRIKNTIKWMPLKRTDMVMCNKCSTGWLCFRDSVYNPNDKNKRASRHFFLGCINYPRSRCTGLIYVDKYKSSEEFEKIVPTSIEERNNWGEEKMTQTVLDKIEKLSEEYQKETTMNKMLRHDIEKLYEERRRMEEKDYAWEELVRKLESEIYTLKKENRQYKKVIGKIYIKH